MASAPTAISTDNLSKRYGKNSIFAVKDLSLQIMAGEVYGFLGPNGAGKSTTIKLLMNFIRPTSGTASILGKDTVKDSVAIKQSIGYLPGDFAFYPAMSGRQFLEYMTTLLPAKRKDYVSQLAKRLNVPLNRRLSDLSKGNRQKIGIIQAFAAEPEVLILDEPTGGLDPLMQEVFFELVRQTKNRGGTTFFSSHNLSEVQKICDRVGFIRNGKLVSQQTIGQLADSAVQTYDIAFTEPSPLAELRRLKGAEITANTPRHASVKITGDLKPLFLLLSHHKVTSVDRREIDLESEFLQYYKGGP